MEFKDLNINENICEALKKQDITKPTEIQAKLIPSMLDGKDIIAKSQTGSGKTLSYLIPIFMKIDTSVRGTQAIILTPTHELASQVHRQAELLNKNAGTDIKSVLIIGGANIVRQIEKLKEKPQIVIGSAGRILDLIKKRKIQAHLVKTIIIDEADRMLDRLNIDGVNDVIKTTLKNSRQTVILSASMNKATFKAAEAIMNEPVIIKGKEEVPEKIKHYYITCEKRDKIVLVRKIMAGLKPEKVMLFINDTFAIEEMVEKLNYHGLKATGIYGAAKKRERLKAIDDFREGRCNILVSSDITSRGMDFENVDIVINIDIPEEPVFYQHRAGRTGRGNKSGTVISLISATEKKWINKYENTFGIKFEQKEMSYGKLQNPTKKHIPEIKFAPKTKKISK